MGDVEALFSTVKGNPKAEILIKCFASLIGMSLKDEKGCNPKDTPESKMPLNKMGLTFE